MTSGAQTIPAQGTALGGSSLPLALAARALAAACGQSWRSQFVFRASMWSGIVGAVLQVILVHLVWTAVYGSRESVAGVDQSVAITYAVLGVLATLVFQPFVFDTLYGRLRTGAIAFDVMRPVSAVPMALAQQLGSSLAQLPAAGCALVVGLALGAVDPPPTIASGVAFAVSITLGLVIAQIMNFTVGLVGFWTLEVGGAFLVYRMLAQFSSGALIPLWFMPGALRAVLGWLPFSAQIFVPISLYVDPDPGWHTVSAIGGQLLWIGLLIVLAALVWRRAIRRLVIFGG
ncbi:ABC transporter permease [Brachybacterium kimchii]|uniref:ABC-2 family transporter protein n=1 Tax=Brachybacterium kimchii TaxID=2942909 RepID=A0ABY4N774_9MICO|nr:ABC-2 family transporter protein [Brachybacterium kimchii]UQN30404.1 ABC-2 family transporter protein [Brachybacterium kimchii]